MPKRFIYIAIFCLLLISLPLHATAELEAVSLEVKFAERNPDLNPSPVLVVCDTFILLEGHTIEAFSGNLSLDILYSGTEDSLALVEITQISLPPHGNTRIEKIKSPLQVPYIVDSVLVKGNSTYRAFFTLLSYDTVLVECEYDHRQEDNFYFDPSGDYDIYFVANSLGDFHWNKIRDYLEYELDQFYNIFDFTQPGKINYFLYPCKSHFYAEFKNSDFGIHPAKNTIFQEYSHITNQIPIYAAALIKLYRYWGYTPRILAEGAANIIEFYQFYCRDYKREEGLYPLKKMLISREYDSLPNHHKARIQSASFVSYLISVTGLNRFRPLYIGATDLSLENDLSQLTGKGLAELEKDWLKYVDTLSYDPVLFQYYAQRELSQRDIAEAIFFYETALQSRPDDSTYLKYLFNTYYLGGYYDKAADCVRKIMELYPSNDYYLTLGNMALAGGQMDTAELYYNLAEKVDSTEEILIYKLGQLAYYRGDYVRAREQFQKLINKAESIPLKIDGHLYLGRIDKMQDHTEAADSHFLQGLNAAKQLISRSSDNSLYNLRAGEAALCLNETKAASEYLSLAEFIELRPFYLGRALLAMGMLYDIKKERELALQYYQRVIDIPSSFLDKSEAEKYLTDPFKL